MRETEEVERFRLSLATPLVVLGGEPPKLDQAGFVGVQLQAEPVEAFPQVFVKLLGIRSVFEAQHNVVIASFCALARSRLQELAQILPRFVWERSNCTVRNLG